MLTDRIVEEHDALQSGMRRAQFSQRVESCTLAISEFGADKSDVRPVLGHRIQHFLRVVCEGHYLKLVAASLQHVNQKMATEPGGVAHDDLNDGGIGSWKSRRALGHG